MIKNDNTPAISVIVPMYNTAKYIRQTLISVLSQKLQEFEVIVVDDCSTDSSVTEVEKLIPHFDGRLKLITRSTNSGCAGIPRNDGINIARGKYIVFLDSDDMLLPTTLKDYFEIAESTKADVLHTEKVLVFNDTSNGGFATQRVGGGAANKKNTNHSQTNENQTNSKSSSLKDNLSLAANEAGDFVEDITFETKDLSERIKRYNKKYFFWPPWGKCFRREFLLKNNIEFPAMKMSEDMIFCFKCLTLAKNYVRIPQLTYIYRNRTDGLMRTQQSAETQMNKWLKVMIEGINLLDEFMGKEKFFNKHPDSRYLVIDFFVKQHFEFLKNLLDSLKPHEVEYLVYRYLKSNPGNVEALLAYLFSSRA